MGKRKTDKSENNIVQNKNPNNKPNEKKIKTYKKEQEKNKQTDYNNLKNNNKKNKKTLKIILLILFVIILSMGGIFGSYVYKSGGNIKGAVMNMVKDVIGEEEPIFVLIMGVSEDISAELTDTIMLAGYNPDSNQAFLLSVPRDTFIGNKEASASGYDKINALYQKSPQKTVEAVEKITGIKIDYYITVKTSALVEIVDAIDGVEFDVPMDMNYDDPSQNLHIHLKKGMQRLNGNQAEQLVRFRHNNNGTTYSAEYGDNDEGRMRTQREFLKATASQVISWNNVDKIKEIVTAVFNNFETNITLSKVLGYIPYIAEFNVENLAMEQLPGESAKINELWFYKLDNENTKELINSSIEKLALTEDEKSKCLIKNTNHINNTTDKNNTIENKNSNKTTNNATNNNPKTKNSNSSIKNNNASNNNQTNRNTSSNKATNKDITSGNTSNNKTTNKDITGSNTSDSKTTNKDITSDNTSSNKTTNKDITDSNTSNSKTTNKDITDSNTSSNKTTNKDITDSSTSSNKTTNNGISDDNISRNKVTNNEITRSNTQSNKAEKNDITDNNI